MGWAAFAQTPIPPGQNTPFRFAARSVPQLLNGPNGFRFTLPENTVYAVVRLHTITPETNIHLLVQRGVDVAGTANEPVFGGRDESLNPNKQVQIGLDSDLAIGSDQPYFVALRAPESAAPLAGVLRLEVRTLTSGGTRVEFSGIQEIMLAGQPDGTQHNGASAPMNSPAEPVPVRPGQGIRFQAVGNSFENYGGKQAGPEGDGDTFGGGAGGDFGLSSVSCPPGAVVGVFAGPAINRNLGGQILPLDFGSEIREREVLRPELQQMFFVGSGLNSEGKPRTYVVPAGATRLYLGRSRTSPTGTGRTLVRVEALEASAVPATVPANPVRVGAATFLSLAGAEAGARDGSNGSAPMHSPAQVAINLVAGQALIFRASGEASEGCTGSVNGPAGSSRRDCSAPNSRGISGYETRTGALIGVFLGATVNRNQSPASVDYTGALANVTPLRPALQQTFLIGDGRTEEGADRRVIVPAGATRLFVAHARGDENQRGSFVVAVAAEAAERPMYTKASIVNGGSFAAGALSPGAIVSIFGQNLGQQAAAASVPLPRTLGGTQVFFDTIPAPLYVVTPGQLNAQVPWELGSAKSAIVTVVRNGVPGVPVEVDLAPYQPGLFAAANIGAILVNSRTGGLVTPQAPARPGDVLVGYATGLGLTAANPQTGEPDAGSPLATTASPTRMVLTGPAGEREVTPLYAGLAPGFIGVYQINFAVPEGLGTGTVKMRLDSVPFGGSPEAEFAVSQ